MKRRVDSGIYAPTYCNHPHRTNDGVPINHECRVLPPEAIEAERRDDFEEAIRILSSKPARYSKGVKVSS